MERLHHLARAGLRPFRRGSSPEETVVGKSHVLVESGGNRAHPSSPGEICVFSKCRNESLRLPAFLAHYRGLGVSRFFVIDNDSSDGTHDYLMGQSDVHVFRIIGGFLEARSGTDWLNGLLGRFGVGAWCLTVDIDELLFYPGREHASLQLLTTHLDRQGSQALRCLLLDLYPAVPLRELSYQPGSDLIAAAPFFDAGPYSQRQCRPCPGLLIRGGVRERLFYPEFRSRGLGTRLIDAAMNGIALRAPFLEDLPWITSLRRRTPPCLTKVPLVRWDATSQYLDCNHWVSEKRVATETGVLLHFKLLQDFHVRAVEEAVRGEYYHGAVEYRRYAEWIAKDAGTSLLQADSVRFEGTAQLVALGLMHDTRSWIALRTSPSAASSTDRDNVGKEPVAERRKTQTD